MPESTAPERITRKTSSIAQLIASRVQQTPDREAYRYPVGEGGAGGEWRSMTWKQAYEQQAKTLNQSAAMTGLSFVPVTVMTTSCVTLAPYASTIVTG